jgi:WD40 repeat protein
VGFLLATAGRDGAVRLWDSRAGSSQRASVEMRVGMSVHFSFYFRSNQRSPP